MVLPAGFPGALELLPKMLCLLANTSACPLLVQSAVLNLAVNGVITAMHPGQNNPQVGPCIWQIRIILDKATPMSLVAAGKIDVEVFEIRTLLQQSLQHAVVVPAERPAL